MLGRVARGVGGAAAGLGHRGALRGALEGLLIAGLLTTIGEMASNPEPMQTFSVQWILRMVVLGTGLILGGLMGLKWLRSRRPG